MPGAHAQPACLACPTARVCAPCHDEAPAASSAAPAMHPRRETRAPPVSPLAVCAPGYGSYIVYGRVGSSDRPDFPTSRPSCNAVPSGSSPKAPCQCLACPPGFASRGGLISRAGCLPKLTFHVRITVAVAAASQLCDARVSAALVTALSATVASRKGVAAASATAELVGCAAVTAQTGVRAERRHAHCARTSCRCGMANPSRAPATEPPAFLGPHCAARLAELHRIWIVLLGGHEGWPAGRGRGARP